MRRLRDAILGIFGEILSGNSFANAMKYTRQTRVCNPHLPMDSIPSTGGIRIDTARQLILVDADKSGGIAHLFNCWQYLEQIWDLLTQTVSLFYIFLAPSRGVINTRRTFWNFTIGKAKPALGNRFEAFFAACVRPPNLDCHADVPDPVIAQYQAQLEEQGILVQFRRLLEGNTPRQTAVINSPKDADAKLQGYLRAVVDEAR